MTSVSFTGQTLPEALPVRVLLRREPVPDNRWIDHRWVAVGLVAGSADQDAGATRSVERDGMLEVLVDGCRLVLYRDECESYYHNLVADHPQCYILTRQDDGDMPMPFQVTLSFDEANAYLETDDVDAHPVPMPPELYRWAEAFVLTHYVPEPRRKRRRDDWRRGQAS